jgi:NTE family protein
MESAGEPESNNGHRPRRVGLALGGGVVRGLAHVGVLSVLLRERIPIDVVAGTSVGALIGSMYCAGVDIEQIRKTAGSIRWWHFARPVFPVLGWLTFAPMERYLIRLIGDLNIENLKIPFAAVATDLHLGQPYVMRQGRVAPAVRASCSVPGLVVPSNHDGRVLCDGGISDNLPVAAARALGADFVIGVNLFDPLFGRPRNLFSIGFAAVETMVRRAGGGLDSCDVLISPDLVGRSYVRFSKKLDIIERGEIAAEAQLPAIRAALGLTDPDQASLEVPPAQPESSL